MMNIFITGATGFIGTRVAQRLLASRHTLRCLVRKPSAAAEQLKQVGAELTAGDVMDRESLSRAMRGCDRVIHLAGLYSFWERDPGLFHAVNVTGTANVMECALEANVAKVVHVSTVGVYGKPADVPFTEISRPGPVRFGRYFQTKAEADTLVWELHRTRALPAVVVYPCAVVGAGDPKATGQYIRDLIDRRLPATVFDDSVLTFVHVNDVAEAIVRALEKEGNIGERYIVGAQRLSFREVALMVAELSGVRLPGMHLPGWVATVNAYLLTWLAGLTGKPPLWGMSVDQMQVMREGFRADGGKAERDLCIRYTPIREAIEEAIASFRENEASTPLMPRA
jgi:dihydroflavonol-4-reductase